MLDRGFEEDLNAILAEIERRAGSAGRCTALLSATLTATAPILRRERVLNLPTEVVRVEGPGVCARHIIFVPGNPGVAAYYQEVAELLTERLNATAAIVGLRGHTEPPAPGLFCRTFSLDEQVEHVSAFLESEARDLGEDKQLVKFNGNDSKNASQCCASWNLGNEHPQKALFSNGKCRYKHGCDRYVSDDGKQCGATDHKRAGCTHPDAKPLNFSLKK